MTIFTGFLVYTCIWWMVLFCVLPWGVRAPEQPPPGHAPSAPERPRIARKMAITTAVATTIFAVVFVIIEYHLISFVR